VWKKVGEIVALPGAKAFAVICLFNFKKIADPLKRINDGQS
jgi:hypothetical protein